MYTILVNDENELYGSHKERIMHRSNCVDTLVFIVDPLYKNIHDMTNASVVLEYVLPVSKRYKTEFLKLSEERYNNCFLQYKLPFNTELTSEAGEISLQLTFAYVEMDENGNMVQRVRKTSSTTINIISVATWADLIPDEALSSLDQRILKIDAQMQGLNDYLNVIDNKQVDNLIYNSNEETLHLSAQGSIVGDKISVKDMFNDGVPVVDLNNPNTDSENKPDDDKDDCNCGCDCEDNVIEFADVAAPARPTDDDENVVEF